MNIRRKKRTLMIFVAVVIAMICTGINANAIEKGTDSVSVETNDDFKSLGSVSNYSIQVNKRYTNQYKAGSQHKLKYKFTLPEAGVVTPQVYINEEKGNNCIGWADYICNMDMTEEYSSSEDSISYEDGDGHPWKIVKYKKCRLPAGTYYFYMGDPGSALNEYGYFDLIINYKSEKSRTNVEKEFNDTRNSANEISLDKTYYGNTHYNDVDYFRFDFKTKTNISLYFYTSSGSYSMDFRPRVVNNNGDTVGYYECLGRFESSNGTEYMKYVYNISLKPGKYYFRVSNFYDSFADYHFIVKTVPSKVSGLKLAAAGNQKVKITYKSAARATKYEIFRKVKGGSWQNVKTTASKSWTNSNLKKGRVYYYKTRAVNGLSKGSFSDIKRIEVK